MDYYYKQPKYFNSFKCIGGDCPQTCCYGWDVLWYKEEYEKLANANCSEHLKNLRESSFDYIEDQGQYMIKMKDQSEQSGKTIDLNNMYVLKRCPFQNEDTGLCEIQKEIGEQYLGAVCVYYPRIIFNKLNVSFRSCMSSCHAVNSLLIKDKDAVRLEMTLARDFRKVRDKAVVHDPKQNLIDRPYLKYRFELLDFYSGLFTRNEEIEIMITLGAIAAKKISDISLNGSEDDIPGVIKDYRKQLLSAKVMDSVNDIKPNYHIKMDVILRLLDKHFRSNSNLSDLSVFYNNGTIFTERIEEGKNKFYNHFEERKYPLRNVITNLFYNMFMNLYPIGSNFYEFYSYFTVCSALVQMLAYEAGYMDKDIENDFIDRVSRVSRSLAHNVGFSERMIRILNEKELNSPAHLALIIK